MDDKLKLYFSKYKRILLPILLIIACFLILFMVILPQISAISEKQTEIAEKNTEINTLKTSISTLASVSSTDLDTYYDIATAALPTQKDISLIFDGLNGAANNSGTTLNNFSISAGGIYGRAAGVDSGTGVPTILTTAHINGADPRDLVSYSLALSKTLPLSEINKMNLSGGEGAYDTGFFYKLVNSQSIVEQDHVPPLSSSDMSLLNQLKTQETK